MCVRTSPAAWPGITNASSLPLRAWTAADACKTRVRAGGTGSVHGSRRVSAHFHTSLPSFRSTWSKSTIQRESGAVVNGMPLGPGGVPRCLRLCVEMKADKAFFSAAVCLPSACCSDAKYCSNACKSARRVLASCPNR
eukprot:6209961-Pleurochrysis_carterae.AAC.1